MPSQTLDQIVSFLREIGLVVIEREIPGTTILPGITVDQGTLVIDRDKLLYPGDLLHEAGHLAVLPKVTRDQLGANVGTDGGMETGAIAWSYAACVHLGMPADVVFHPFGYKGASASMIENFTEGRSIGVPILVWRGLTNYPTGESPCYPAMKKWLTD